MTEYTVFQLSKFTVPQWTQIANGARAIMDATGATGEATNREIRLPGEYPHPLILTKDRPEVDDWSHESTDCLAATAILLLVHEVAPGAVRLLTRGGRSCDLYGADFRPAQNLLVRLGLNTEEPEVYELLASLSKAGLGVERMTLGNYCQSFAGWHLDLSTDPVNGLTGLYIYGDPEDDLATLTGIGLPVTKESDGFYTLAG